MVHEIWTVIKGQYMKFEQRGEMGSKTPQKIRTSFVNVPLAKEHKI